VNDICLSFRHVLLLTNQFLLSLIPPERCWRSIRTDPGSARRRGLRHLQLWRGCTSSIGYHSQDQCRAYCTEHDKACSKCQECFQESPRLYWFVYNPQVLTEVSTSSHLFLIIENLTSRDLNPNDNLRNLRIKTATKELILSADKDFLIVVIQEWTPAEEMMM